MKTNKFRYYMVKRIGKEPGINPERYHDVFYYKYSGKRLIKRIIQTNDVLNIETPWDSIFSDLDALLENDHKYWSAKEISKDEFDRIDFCANL